MSLLATRHSRPDTTAPRPRETKIGVLGAGGRMGREVIAAVRHAEGARLAGAVEHADHGCVGRLLDEGLVIGANALPLAHASDVLIDFTVPDALGGHLDAAEAAGAAILVGTTSLEPAHHARLDRAAKTVAVLQAANTSLGVTLMSALAEKAAARLANWDAEILDLHHGAKRDAPSGTALALAEAVRRGRRTQAPLAADRASRHEPRRAGEIGIASLRGGTPAGEHRLMLLGEGERLEFTHVAESRAIFASGAVRAAMWLSAQPAGRYTMREMLGL